MPTIYDNISDTLLQGLEKVLTGAISASFCVGYLHLRGWRLITHLVEQLPGGEGKPPCRILVGMQRLPEEILSELQGLASLSGEQNGQVIGGSLRSKLKRQILESFKRQLHFGIPTAEAEETLQRFARHLKTKKIQLKSFLRYPLHAKLYLVERNDPITPLIGFVGSSNFTEPGLLKQGELNVDVVDQDAARKLAQWFEQRWTDPLAVDVTAELVNLIEHSWVGQRDVRPYLIYLKMAYYLSTDAREGEREYKLPAIFAEEGTPLLDFQERAVSLAARYLYRRGGALLGDVVGLGKTLMAVAIARIFQEDSDSNTLVICPPKLKPMWDDYLRRYRITGEVLSLGDVQRHLRSLPRYRLLIIDESHNLRNREGKRYRAITDYIKRNEPRVLLLTATPFNKHYQDLSNQLRLFIDQDADLGVRPERFFQDWTKNGKTEADFRAQYQTLPTSLRAFEQSPYPEDWQDLMRLFLVRRTRSFIMRNYAQFDSVKKRHYVTMNGQRFYFPLREPRTVKFPIHKDANRDPYARLFSDRVVSLLASLHLPRYGLALYLQPYAETMADQNQKKVIDNLNRAGRRLIGFCRTNFLKRLESSGQSFLLSVQRHIMRNYVTLYALENDLEVPIGVQDVALFDATLEDEDGELLSEQQDETDGAAENSDQFLSAFQERSRTRAREIYEKFREQAGRFSWLPARFFQNQLRTDLEKDIRTLEQILDLVPAWDPNQDRKLQKLERLLNKHRSEKVLVFTQFADTARYLGRQLKQRGIPDLEVVTAESPDPVALARRFSPKSNGGLREGETELRVLIATDVLAEGQNLQDCHIVVNYDLPWAIIRLIQRAGRVDRIGQTHDTILVYSFLPAEGIEQIIRLRHRLFERLKINQEVIGTDESFFGEKPEAMLRDLYAEKPGILDDDEKDEDIDLASLALQVWNNASEDDRKAAQHLPPLVSSTAPVPADSLPGMIAFLRFPGENDVLVRVNEQGELVSQSPSAIFRAAACTPDTVALPRHENHFQLIARCVQASVREKSELGGQLGSYRSVARKVYECLRDYRAGLDRAPASPSVSPEDLDRVLDLMFRYPLKEDARETLHRQLRLEIPDDDLAKLVVNLWRAEKLCQVKDDSTEPQEPEIVCALGLRKPADTLQGEVNNE